MGESYVYQRLPYARGGEEAEAEDEERSERVMRANDAGPMVKCGAS